MFQRALSDGRLSCGCEPLYQREVSNLFVALPLQAQQRLAVDCQSAHLETTLLAVDGESASSSEVLMADAPVPIRLTYGYPRDH